MQAPSFSTFWDMHYPMKRDLELPDAIDPKTAMTERLSAVSAERNAAPILAELKKILTTPQPVRVLELASGTGQHAAQFASAFPLADWQPSDANSDMFASIQAWAENIPNIRSPVCIDVGMPGWSSAYSGYDVTLTVNLLHLISQAEAQSAISGIAKVLSRGGLAVIYGPFRRDGRLTSQGDQDFDAQLRAQDATIGYKDVSDVQSWAKGVGLEVRQAKEMPANNLLLVFQAPV